MIQSNTPQLSLDEIFELETPENIELTYTLAGIGSRFAAALVDSFVLLFLLFINALLFVLILAPQIEHASKTGEYVIIAIWSLLSLAIFWGYYIAFEVFWNGQTPGKRLFHLRVLRSTGYPVTLADVIVRNFVRIIDLLPNFYAAGVITMMITKRAQRLGDLAAGTVVVKDQKRITLSDLGVDLQAQPAQTAPVPIEPIYTNPPALPAQPTLLNIERLHPEDFQAVRVFFERAGRNEIQPELIASFGRRLAYALATRIDYRGPLYSDQQCAGFLREIMRNERR